MRRLAVPVAVLAVTIVGLLAGRGLPGARAHDGTPIPTAGTPIPVGHPLVGSWRVTFAFEAQNQPPVELISLATYTSDGTLVVANAGQMPSLPLGAGLFLTEGHGAWVPTGERAADATFVFVMLDQSGGLASINTARTSLEVNATGDAYVGTFTLDMVEPEGNPFAPPARGTFEAIRIQVEPPGISFAATPAVGSPAASTPAP